MWWHGSHRCQGVVMQPRERSGVASREDVVRAASEFWLRGEPIDMSTLARRLQLSRATLYRRVGNHEQLLSAVIAEQTELTWHHVVATWDYAGQDVALYVDGGALAGGESVTGV